MVVAETAEPERHPPALMLHDLRTARRLPRAGSLPAASIHRFSVAVSTMANMEPAIARAIAPANRRPRRGRKALTYGAATALPLISALPSDHLDDDARRRSGGGAIGGTYAWRSPEATQRQLHGIAGLVGLL